MKNNLTALLSGTLFGFGLSFSRMLNPAVVLNFLDVSGAFDPALAYVMGGALIIAVPGFRILLKRPTALDGSSFQLPSKTKIDHNLVLGAGLFGIGWGLAGICPGPAIAGLALGEMKILVFLLALVAGMLSFNLTESKRI